MRESKVEAHLRKAAKARGGLAMKFVSPNMVGVPDRLVILPRFRSFFVETKAPGKDANEVQARRHRQLRDLGAEVYVADTIEKVDQLLAKYDHL